MSHIPTRTHTLSFDVNTPTTLTHTHVHTLSQAKEWLCSAIDEYLRVRIFLADEAISESCSSMIKNGDVILVYA